jgi:apolipoprotein D and lipocalin family protein
MNPKKIFSYSLPILAGVGILLWANSAKAQDLETVPNVDLDRYAGKWFEIASFPKSFQKGCGCTTATYTPTDNGYIEVLNTCCKTDKNKQIAIMGKAFVEEGSGNAKLEVQFFWPLRGKYWIIALAEDYSFAMVGHPDRKSLWILSRTTELSPEIYQKLVDIASLKGFDLNKLQKTPSCN